MRVGIVRGEPDDAVAVYRREVVECPEGRVATRASADGRKDQQGEKDGHEKMSIHASSLCEWRDLGKPKSRTHASVSKIPSPEMSGDIKP
jgi:hypothetical protein